MSGQDSVVQLYLETEHSSVISTSNGKRYLGLSMLNICSHSVLYTVCERCVAFPDGLVSQMRLLASSMENYIIQKKSRDLLADLRNIQSKMVHHQEWP